MESKLPDRRKESAACPHCGAALAGRGIRCSYCGAVLREKPSDDELYRASEALIRSCSKELESISSGRLMLAFLFFILAVPTGGHLLVRMAGAAGGLLWIATAVILLAGAATFGVVLEIEQKRLFREKILPDLRKFIRERELSPDEFLLIARRALREDEPLMKHLSGLF